MVIISCCTTDVFSCKPRFHELNNKSGTYKVQSQQCMTVKQRRGSLTIFVMTRMTMIYKMKIEISEIYQEMGINSRTFNQMTSGNNFKG